MTAGLTLTNNRCRNLVGNVSGRPLNGGGDDVLNGGAGLIQPAALATTPTTWTVPATS
jgi:hypothetical protein